MAAKPFSTCSFLVPAGKAEPFCIRRLTGRTVASSHTVPERKSKEARSKGNPALPALNGNPDRTAGNVGFEVAVEAEVAVVEAEAAVVDDDLGQLRASASPNGPARSR